MIARLTTDYNKPIILLVLVLVFFPRTDCCLLIIALSCSLLAIASTNTFAVVPTVSGV